MAIYIGQFKINGTWHTKLVGTNKDAVSAEIVAYFGSYPTRVYKIRLTDVSRLQ